jgi:hypothetical protein
LQKQSKPFDHKTESHERDGGALPRQQGALSREKDSRVGYSVIGIVGHLFSLIGR